MNKTQRDRLKEFAFRVEKVERAQRAEAVDVALEMAPGANRLYLESRKLFRKFDDETTETAIRYINRGKDMCYEATKGFTKIQKDVFYKVLEIYAINHGNEDHFFDMAGTFRDCQKVLTGKERATAKYLANPEKYGKALENTINPDKMSERIGEEAVEYFGAFA